jgi:glycosyltransferase involved in cell wall biosynthesis
LVGPTELSTAFARVNARWAEGLRAAGHVVTGGPAGAAFDDGPVDVAVLHDYSVPFGPIAGDGVGSEGPKVAVRTWDFGPFPERWCHVVRDHFDELWVHSPWNRELAVRGGVPADRVRVVPLGADLGVLRPDGPVHPETQRNTTTFLFVGATVRRKGVDVLLDAYGQAFGAGDDVRLVVKDHTRDVFYRGLGHGDAVRAMAEGGGPAVTYLDEELDPGGLASLYRGATALVLPFRAEGFALPPLEAMACGTPVVVPRFGPVLAYADDDTAWFTPHRRISLPVGRRMAYNALGYEEVVEEVDLAEPSVAGLVAVLREVASTSGAQRAARGAAAAAAAQSWSWEASVEQVDARLRAVARG